jgi:hypothetical protein
MSDERRAYHQEYLRKKYASDPEYREQVKQKTQKRREAGYFSGWQKKKRAEGGDELKAKEAEAMRVRRAANPAKAKEISNRCKAKTRKERPHLLKHQQLSWAYGMSLEEYEQRLVAQSGACFICKGNNGGKRLVVDHDHSKPKGEGNRGLLCRGCNIALGAVKEDVVVLRALATYLESF